MSINVTNVSYLIVDSVEQNIQFELNLMAGRDGEVIKVDATSHEVALIVEWHDFLEGIIFTKSYRIVGEWVDETSIGRNRCCIAPRIGAVAAVSKPGTHSSPRHLTLFAS